MLFLYLMFYILKIYHAIPIPLGDKGKDVTYLMQLA